MKESELFKAIKLKRSKSSLYNDVLNIASSISDSLGFGPFGYLEEPQTIKRVLNYYVPIALWLK